MNPRVSVIIPAWNAAKTLPETLRSLHAQTCQDFETIVVDDGSTDGTADLVARDWPDVRLLRQPNGGPAAARNTGAAQASGEWLAFLDADDAWLPWRLQLQLTLAQQHPQIILWAGQRHDLGAQKSAPAPPPGDATPTFRHLTLDELAIVNNIPTSTVLLQRRTFDDVGGFDTRFRGPEDYDLWLRVAATGTIGFIEHPLTLYRIGEESLSQDDRRFLPEVLRVLRHAYAEGGVLAGHSTHRQARAVQYAANSWIAYLRGARLRALRLMLTSLLLVPLHLPWPKLAGTKRWKLLLAYLRKPPQH